MPHGASVRIYKSTHMILGHVAEWYRVSRRFLIESLIVDRLERLNERTSPQIDAVFRRKAGDVRPIARPALEDVLNDLFGLNLKVPLDGGRGREELATSMRVSDDTHRAMALVADWYDRFIPHVYDALLLDRLMVLFSRVADEYAMRKPQMDFKTTFREAFGFELPDISDDDDTAGVREGVL